MFKLARNATKYIAVCNFFRILQQRSPTTRSGLLAASRFRRLPVRVYTLYTYLHTVPLSHGSLLAGKLHS